MTLVAHMRSKIRAKPPDMSDRTMPRQFFGRRMSCDLLPAILHANEGAGLAIGVDLKAEVAMNLYQALYANTICRVKNRWIVIAPKQSESCQSHRGGNIFGGKPCRNV